MPATTAKYKIPYPVAADKVSVYPATAKQCADTLETVISSTSTTVTPANGWSIYNGTNSIKSSGAVHWLSLDFQRTGTPAELTAFAEYALATLPESVPAPADWSTLGQVTIGAVTSPVIYRSEGRKIIFCPMAAHSVNKNQWIYGSATWIA